MSWQDRLERRQVTLVYNNIPCYEENTALKIFLGELFIFYLSSGCFVFGTGSSTVSTGNRFRINLFVYPLWFCQTGLTLQGFKALASVNQKFNYLLQFYG